MFDLTLDTGSFTPLSDRPIRITGLTIEETGSTTGYLGTVDLTNVEIDHSGTTTTIPITITPTPTYEGWGEITITLVDGEDYKANTTASSRIAKVVIEEAETSSRTIAITAPEAVIEGDNVEVVLTTSESLGAGESIEVAFNIVADSVGYYDANGSDTSPVTFTDAGNEQTITIATNDSDSFTTEGYD